MSELFLKFEINQFDSNIKSLINELSIHETYNQFLNKFKGRDDKKFKELMTEYFKQKYIYNQIDDSEKVLFEIFKNFEITQIICQNLFGYNNIQRINIVHLLDFYKINLKDNVLTSYLMILNKLNFLTYNKKNGQIKIIYNAFEENAHDFKLPEITLLNPEKPFTNRLILRKYVSVAKEFIYWFDKYLDKNIFEILALEVSGNIKIIKILTTNSQYINEDFKKQFILLRKEFENKGITFECNIINAEISREIHDRWFITYDKKFNFPSFQSFFKGQYSEIKETQNEINFEEWWKNSRKLIE